ncbi:hypothetical protein L7F22_055684 [Adiantum nelumboides]|nr:hypothetical protein [Adiantum nelumboides]
MAGTSKSNHCIKVQSPNEGPFDANSLHWELIHDRHSKYSALQVAYILWDRIQDFLKGECTKEDWPTQFNVSWRRNTKENTLKRPSIDSHLIEIGYWCAFGPDDYRGEIPKATSKRRAQAGKTKSGCQCHFVVTQLYLWPHIGRINFIEWNHVDLDDNICHGKLYCGPEKRLQLAPAISREMKQWVFYMLLKGFTPQQVFSHHIGIAEQNMMGGSLHKTRDLFLTMRDILNIACKMENITIHTDSDDAKSVHNWVADNASHVFFYQPMDSVNEKPFALGIQTTWQLETICKYGNRGLLAMDSTFGTNKYKFQLYTVLVFDGFRNGVPVAWVITSSSTRVNTSSWLTALRNRAFDHCKAWDPNAWMVDDAEAEILSLRQVFGLPILLCIWHVRRAWLKNLVKKVRDPQVRADMFKKLGMIMNMRGRPGTTSCKRVEEAHNLLDQFFVEYASEQEFITYFKRQWLPCIDMWIKATRTMQVANQDTNGSIESYHGLLKSRFLSGRRTIHGRRIDWLIKGLVSTCHSYYWYQDALKEAGFKRNFKVMDVIKNSLARALEILDENVGFYGDDPRHARVFSMTKQLHFYLIRNADMEWATCDCDWALRGNLCKHQVKVMILGGISIETILHRGIDMYNTMVIDGTPCIGVKKGFQNSQLGMANNMCPSNLQDTPTIFSEENNVEEPMETAKVDSLADYGKQPSSSSLVPPTSIELIADIKSLIAQTLKLAGDDLCLLQHVQRSSTQMLISLQACKACQTSMLSHPIKELERVDDGFGTSLVHAKPIIETILQKKRKKMTTKNKADEQDVPAVRVKPFPLLPRRKRVSLQSVLDKQACQEDSD